MNKHILIRSVTVKINRACPISSEVLIEYWKVQILVKTVKILNEKLNVDMHNISELPGQD